MTRTAPASAVPSPAFVVWLLGVADTIGYGTIYYSFGILAPAIARDFAWPAAWIFGVFSIGLLASGAVAPIAGRMLDRYGAPRNMIVGTIVVALALALTASGSKVAFVVGLVLTQAASAFVLYDAAFVCLAQVYRADARRRITQLTLIAGFASSIFWPLTTGLEGWLGWQGTVMLFAGLNLFLLLPGYLWLARVIARSKRLPAADEASKSVEDTAFDRDGSLPVAVRPRAMVLLAMAFALGGFVLSGILTQMVPLLNAVGLGAASVLVSTLFGPSQVLVRFATVLAGPARSPMAATLVAAAMLPVAAVTLALSGASVAGAVLFAVALGFGSGLKSIVQGTLPLALFGREGYGARMGRLSAVRQVLGAVAPFVLAAVIEAFGAAAALYGLAAIGFLGFLAVLEIMRLARRSGTV